MKWISVDDRLPDKTGRYLVAYVEQGRLFVTTRKYKSIYDLFQRGNDFQWPKGTWDRNDASITHWMSLPEPPTE